MPHRKTSRRDFMRSSGSWAALAAMTATTLPASNAAGSTSAHDRPHIGAIGVGGRGLHVTRQAAAFGNVVAVCDVDARQSDRAKTAFDGRPATYSDYRRLLDRNDIDVVINGTPDHWHTAVCVAACRAGKDVYTEKPLTLTIDEGKLLRRVVAETGRVVQVGTQQRSEKPFQTAVELVRNGRIGKLQQVWVVLPYFSTKGGPFPAAPVPDGLDWNLYQGQAPEHAYCKQRTHSNFRWWYEYAGGIVTDWGNHHLDIAHWGMDCELTGPRSIEARGLFPNPKADQHYNTPDRFFSRMRYPNDVEVLYFASLKERLLYGEVQQHESMTPEQIDWLFGKDVPDEVKAYERNGIMFLGERGRVFVNRGGAHGKPVEELAENPLPAEAWRVPASDDHMDNFFACIKSRQEPVSPVRIQHRTVTACHLTNISLRLGRPLRWDPETEQIVGDDEANGWLRREQRAPFEVMA